MLETFAKFKVRLVAVVLAFGVAIVGALALPAPAHAAGGSTSAGNGVIYGACGYHPFKYSLDVAGFPEWWVQFDVINPAGQRIDRTYKYEGDDPSTGSGRMFFCNPEPPGRFTLRATLHRFDSASHEQVVQLPNTSFSMRRPDSRTALQVSDLTPRYNQVLTFKVRTTHEIRGGYSRTPYAHTFLQRRTARGWVLIPGSRKEANQYGSSATRLRWTFRTAQRVRAVSRGTSGYQPSRSTVRVLR